MRKALPEANSQVAVFMRQLRKHYTFLEVKTDNEFFKKIGLADKAHFNWYNIGIRKIYFFILFLLNKIEKLRKEVDKLEKEAIKREKRCEK